MEQDDIKSENDSVAEIGIYELIGYATAVKRYQKMSLERKEFFKSLYQMASPFITGVDYDEGHMFVLGRRTESIALQIIDEKRLYDARLGKERRKTEMFERAMSYLDEMEREVIRIRYQAKKDETTITLAEFYRLVARSEKKLIKNLTNESQKRLNEMRKTLLQESSLNKAPIKVCREKIRITEPYNERSTPKSVEA
ncbi:MAG: hypothetical protein Q8934_14220 [Bacillota bacterium]|nr:hypothetical protein [Bacillota bacterium]